MIYNECPRGFKWCEDKQECVPEGISVDDKLTKKYERYFFKGDVGTYVKEENTTEQKQCPKGTVWCPNSKKCIPSDEQRSKGEGKGKGYGRGQGPVGVPKQEQQIEELVDEVFDGGFSQFAKKRKVEKKIDTILDAISEDVKTTGRPYDHPIKMKISTSLDGKADISVDECGAVGPLENDEEFESSEFDNGSSKELNPQKIYNSINPVPNQNPSELLKSVRQQMSENRLNEDYQEFFRSMLNKFNVNSPSELNDEDKRKFFTAIKSGWKKKKVSEVAPIVVGAAAGAGAGAVIYARSRKRCKELFPKKGDPKYKLCIKDMMRKYKKSDSWRAAEKKREEKRKREKEKLRKAYRK